MKKQIKQSKLVLQTQTIRALDDAAKAIVVGGLRSMPTSYMPTVCASATC